MRRSFPQSLVFCAIAMLLACIHVSSVLGQGAYTSKDSVRIYELLNAADEFSDSNIDSAMSLARAAGALSKRKKMLRGEGWALLKIAELKKYTSRQDSIEFLDLAGIRVATLIKDDFMHALGRLQLGQHYMFKHRYKESEVQYRSSLAIKFEKDQSDYTAIVYNDLGFLFRLKGEYEKEIEWLLKARRLGEKLNDPYTTSLAATNLATANSNLGNSAAALKYIKEAIAIREKSRDVVGLTNNYNSLARFLIDSLPAAIHYQKLALKYSEQSGVKGNIAASYGTMAMLLGKQGKYGESLAFEKKAIAIFKELGDKPKQADRNLTAANMALKLGDPVAAEQFFDKSFILASEIKSKSNLRDLFYHKSIYYRDKKDYFNAYDSFKKYVAYKDSLIQQETQSNVAELQLKYETEKKDNQIALLNTESRLRKLQIEKQNFTRNGIIAGVLILFLLAGVLFNRFKLKKKIEQQQALINFRNDVARDLHDDIGSTLTSIKILSEISSNNLSKDQEKAGTYLKKITEQSTHIQQEMSDIVWAITPDNDKLGNMLVRMREFINHTLEPKNIMTDFAVDEQALSSSLNMHQRRDFFLIFKEAINNIAKYSAANTVKINLRKTQGQILLSITDDGIGFDLLKESSSNGVKNMKARAAGLHGTIDITTKPGAGTMVRLTIPVS
ncbi:tetratricopeptide repeat-containing sensor histidine kinase [Dyadobacter sp. MSC1_007]|jgi:two-component system sensor histidine kinase UhpB|uniref:tetratricopeptide repeat-containing sensor histidine kinase n=1 Tax=Dyadobacter sp. MSC1_007 TaxID=2909264 RepID=UPI00202F5366|nr:tetratricopeptide repeat protein [Dyadobacter sp. MSC1_007]